MIGAGSRWAGCRADGSAGVAAGSGTPVASAFVLSAVTVVILLELIGVVLSWS